MSVVRHIRGKYKKDKHEGERDGKEMNEVGLKIDKKEE